MKSLPIIYGFNESSEMGVNVFSPSIFLGGCNLKCPYCMNYKLISAIDLPPVDIQEVKSYIEDNNCEWLNISGGEPTCIPENTLLNLIEEIKSWGCKIGMATNGTKPNVLRFMLKHLDYVALDIKTPRNETYNKISLSKKDVLAEVLLSQGLLAEEKINRDTFAYEIRTTLYPLFIDEKALVEIGSVIRKDDNWVLQKFRNNIDMLDSGCKDVTPYTDKEIKRFLDVAKKVTKNAYVRNV